MARAGRARRRRQAVRGHAACRAGRDRRRCQAGAGTRGRDHPVLASWIVAVGHRTRCCDARQSGAPGDRPDAALRLSAAMLVANARMYTVAPAADAAWRTLLAWVA